MTKSPIFIIFLLFIATSCSNSFLSKKMRSTQEIDAASPKKIHFIVNVFPELPSGRNIFRTKQGKDFFNFDKPSFSRAQPAIQKITNTIKFITNKYSIDQRPTDFAMASVSLSQSESNQFYKEIAYKIFNPSGNREFTVHPLIYSQKNYKEFMISAEEDNGHFDLNLLSYGYFRKQFGLNLHPQVCPAMKEALLKKSETKSNELKAFLSSNNYDDTIASISKKIENKEFIGINSRKENWVFVKEKSKLKPSVNDLNNLLEDANYSMKFGQLDVSEDDSSFKRLNKLRADLFDFYFKNLKRLIGQLFSSFIVDMLDLRESLLNNPLSATRASKVKNFLAIGSFDVTKDLYVRYLAKVLNIQHSFESYEKSLFLVFSGNDDLIDTVEIYLDDILFANISMQEFTKATLPDIDQMSSNLEDFNMLCINKKSVTSFDKDY